MENTRPTPENEVQTKQDVSRKSPRQLLVEFLRESEENFFNDVSGEVGGEKTPANKPHGDSTRAAAFKRARAYKFALAAVAVVAVGIGPIMRLSANESAQAVLNARVVTVRAPINGVLSHYGSTTVGTMTSFGQAVVTINNDHADRSTLNIIKRDWLKTNAEKDGLSQRIKTAEEERNSLLEADKQHKSARLEQFRFRKQQILELISAAKARLEAANASYTRISWLAERGLSTTAQLEIKRQDKEVAARAVSQNESQLAEVQVEYDAEQRGIRLTDDHNISTSMKERADRLAFEINNWKRDLEKQQHLLAELNEDLEREKMRYAEKEMRVVNSPVGGPIWEILTASGELVNEGQPLFRVLDCSGILVSTSVSEATYNKLQVGDPAIFRSGSDLTEYEGRIIKMHGLAAPRANLAIMPEALSYEPFHITMKSDKISDRNQCTVGQTGIVSFRPLRTQSVFVKFTHWLKYWVRSV